MEKKWVVVAFGVNMKLRKCNDVETNIVYMNLTAYLYINIDKYCNKITKHLVFFDV